MNRERYRDKGDRDRCGRRCNVDQSKGGNR